MQAMQWRVLWLLGCGWIATVVGHAVVSLAQDVRLEGKLVPIEVMVLDQDGNYVTDLRHEEFILTHDGVNHPIAFFEAQSARSLTRPVAIVFALDVSGSLGAQVKDQQRAAQQFVRAMRQPVVSAVIGFNDRIHVYQNFTTDVDKLRQGFAKARNIGGRTRLYDAIDRAVTMLQRDAPGRFEGRRVRRLVVVVTDGFDYTSLISPQEVIRRANQADVTVYAVILPSYVLSPLGKRRIPTLLDATGLVERTGGKTFSIDDQNYVQIFSEIAAEVRASYLLAFYPLSEPSARGRSHRIKVTTTRPGVKVRQSRYEYSSALPSRP